MKLRTGVASLIYNTTVHMWVPSLWTAATKWRLAKPHRLHFITTVGESRHCDTTASRQSVNGRAATQGRGNKHTAEVKVLVLSGSGASRSLPSAFPIRQIGVEAPPPSPTLQLDPGGCGGAGVAPHPVGPTGSLSGSLFQLR